jgi:hypothetical protein
MREFGQGIHMRTPPVVVETVWKSVSFSGIFAGQRRIRAIQSAQKWVKRPGKTPNGVDAVNTHTDRCTALGRHTRRPVAGIEVAKVGEQHVVCTALFSRVPVPPVGSKNLTRFPSPQN